VIPNTVGASPSFDMGMGTDSFAKHILLFEYEVFVKWQADITK